MNLPPRVLWVFSLVVLVTTFSGCDYARMQEQESLEPYEVELPEMPRGSVPVQDGIAGLRMSAPQDLTNPLTAGTEEVARGKQSYEYFCVMCHGPRGGGKGTVGQSFAPLPTDLTSRYVREQPDGRLYRKISLGFRRHPPLAHTVSQRDRWAVILYIRSLGQADS